MSQVQKFLCCLLPHGWLWHTFAFGAYLGHNECIGPVCVWLFIRQENFRYKHFPGPCRNIRLSKRIKVRQRRWKPALVAGSEINDRWGGFLNPGGPGWLTNGWLDGSISFMCLFLLCTAMVAHCSNPEELSTHNIWENSGFADTWLWPRISTVFAL